MRPFCDARHEMAPHIIAFLTCWFYIDESSNTALSSDGQSGSAELFEIIAKRSFSSFNLEF